MRAEHVEQLLMGLLVERLAEPHAAELLRGKTFDTADAEKLRTEETVLLARLDDQRVRERLVNKNRWPLCGSWPK